MMRIAKWVAGAAVAALAGVAVTGPVLAAEKETVTLSDKDGKFEMEVSRKDLTAGKVTFDVVNKSESGVQHEMIVVKLTPQEVADPGSLPYNEETGTIDEEKINDRGEVSELDPGKAGSLTLELNPGTYMLLCNVAGHYKAGMYTLIHVS